jgi:hypothetical protein
MPDAAEDLRPDAADDRRAPGQPPLLVFFHIPKTAGTTLTTVLRMNEPGARTRHGGNVFKGGGGVKHGVTFENLLKNSGGELDRARILTGHFPLGIREYIPREREARYFTFLREPADRTLSHFFQIREKRGGSEEPNKFDLPPLPADATVEDALERGYLHDNVQTRMLSGLTEPFGDVTDEMLEQAKHNLREELAFFGLTERFDESLVLAQRRLGFRSILYRSPAGTRSDRSARRATGRVSTTRPRGDEVPEDLAEAAEACNRYDIELYRYAEELFDAAPERQGLEFEVEVAALRAAKADGEIDLAVPPPDRFDGDGEAWRMLLHTTAASLRREREIAKSNAQVEELSQREQEVLEELVRIHAAGKSTAGQDAETAMRLIQLLAPARAEAIAEATPEPEAAIAPSTPEPQAAPTKRDRRQRKRSTSSPPDGAGQSPEVNAEESAPDTSGDGRARKPRRGGARGRRQRASRSDSDRVDSGPGPDAVRPRKRRATDPGRG